ncbi:hypothetical protein [Nostoc sp. NZL]|nr:hypothetical protein [Nostoc sp. NZL]
MFLSTIVSPSEKVFLRPHHILIRKNPDEDTTAAIVNRLLGW